MKKGYNTKVHKFFSKEERDKVKKATMDAESLSTGEIAVVLVDHSSQYREAEVTGGIFLSSVTSFILSVACFHGSIWFYVPLSFLFYFPFYMLFKKNPVLKVALVSAKRQQNAVRDRALRAFYEKGLHRTKDSTGVMLFLSLLERKVWVIADKGIHEKIKQHELDRFAHIVSEGVRTGNACDALCKAINEMGLLLARYYPVTSEDKNELSDDIIFDSNNQDIAD